MDGLLGVGLVGYVKVPARQNHALPFFHSQRTSERTRRVLNVSVAEPAMVSVDIFLTPSLPGATLLLS